MTVTKKIAIRNGIVATLILFFVYVLIVSLVSGFAFMVKQLEQFWYFIFPLNLGFGIQVGLYSYLKKAIQEKNHGAKMLAVTGTTSTLAMVSCCAHYLVNLLPILGTVGIITIISQYQVGFFWLGLIFNTFGIIFMAHRVKKFHRSI